MIDLFIEGSEGAAQSSHSTITEERHYINLCAFIACYWHNGHEEWTDWAMWLSQDALEEDHLKPLTNLFGQAVAQLFLFSGPEMYASGNAVESSKNSFGPLLRTETQTATLSRWEFWKRRLIRLKTSEILDDETQVLFSKALESMAKVEAEIGSYGSKTCGAKEVDVDQGSNITNVAGPYHFFSSSLSNSANF